MTNFLFHQTLKRGEILTFCKDKKFGVLPPYFCPKCFSHLKFERTVNTFLSCQADRCIDDCICALICADRRLTGASM